LRLRTFKVRFSLVITRYSGDMKKCVNLKNLKPNYSRLIALKFTYLTCKVQVQKIGEEEHWIQSYRTIRLIETSVYP
jgi:hypothetical protein